MKKLVMAAIVVLAFAISVQAQAGISETVWQAIEQAYEPAVWSEQLKSAHKDPDPANFRSYVVVMVGGMAAERAERFISWGNYDYRSVTIDAARGEIKNRRGKAYTYLQPGNVMAVAGLKKYGNTVSIKLISPDVYIPLNRAEDKKFSRVTNTVRMKLPKEAADSNDPNQVISMMSQYLKPFQNIQSAQRFAPSVSQTATATSKIP